MAQNLSAGAQQALEVIAQSRRKLDRIHGLIEQYAVAKGPTQDHLAGMIARAALDVGRGLLQQGMGVLADHANQLGMLARRGGGPSSKLRGMREYLAQLRPGLERAERSVHERDAAEQGERGGGS